MLFNLAGISLVFTFQKARLRREMKAQIKGHIPKDQLHKFSDIAAGGNDILWTRKGKEFMLNGEMYDIVYSEKEKDSTYYYCINDSEETRLFAHLDEMVGKKMKEESNSGKQSGKLIRALTSLVYIGNEYPPLTERLPSVVRYYLRMDGMPLAPYLEYVTPPPRLS